MDTNVLVWYMHQAPDLGGHKEFEDNSCQIGNFSSLSPILRGFYKSVTSNLRLTNVQTEKSYALYISHSMLILTPGTNTQFDNALSHKILSSVIANGQFNCILISAYFSDLVELIVL